MSSDEFDGVVVLVTGAGSGIGRAMTQEFAARGARLGVVDIDGDAAERTLCETGARGVALACDVSDASQVQTAVATVLQAYGRVDVLCNNAGILDDYRNALDTQDELWHRIIAVNLTGQYLLAKHVLPTMISRGSGAIVNTASIAAHVAGGGGTAYTVAKHGVLGLTRQLAFDFGAKGVRVNALCPGAVASAMSAHLRTPGGGNEHVSAIIDGTPAGRWGAPAELAKVAAFLASNDASFLHGSAVTADGGWTLA